MPGPAGDAPPDICPGIETSDSGACGAFEPRPRTGCPEPPHRRRRHPSRVAPMRV